MVLSVAMEVSEAAKRLARTVKVDLNQHDFVATGPAAPVASSRPGVYVCGAMQGPKDIPESVMQASAAAGAVSATLGDVRWTRTKTREVPPEVQVRPEDTPRIGVFVCNCGINIGGIINVPEAEGIRPQPPQRGARGGQSLHLLPGYPGESDQGHQRTAAQPGGGGGLYAPSPMSRCSGRP